MTPFDRAAATYDAVRPRYPDALVEDALALARVPARGRLLEVGCGTGQATRLFAAHGHRIVAVDAGARMVELARERLAALDVEVVHAAFETAPLAGGFDLVYSATAWHWVDPSCGWRRAATLAPSLALFWNEHVRGDDDVGFFDATARLYERAGLRRDRLLPQAPRDRTADIVASGFYDRVVRRQYPWHAEYDADTYVKLLSTYSDHILLADETRSALLSDIAALIETRFGGVITKHYVSDLYVARALR